MRKYGRVMIALLLFYMIVIAVILSFHPGKDIYKALWLFCIAGSFSLVGNRFSPIENVPWNFISFAFFGPPMLLTILTMELFKNKIDWTDSGLDSKSDCKTCDHGKKKYNTKQ